MEIVQNEEPKMNKYQSYALNHYLSDYPENLSFNEILELLLDENEFDSITVADHYELYDESDIADFILEMVRSLERHFS